MPSIFQHSKYFIEDPYILNILSVFDDISFEKEFNRHFIHIFE